MPPSTFFLSGLVKVSEKRSHQCQGPGGEGERTSVFFFLFPPALIQSPKELQRQRASFSGSRPLSQPHIPVARVLLIPQTGKPGHFQSSVFPLEVWDPLKKILCSVTFVTSGYPNKARERTVHFFHDQTGNRA